MEATLEMLNVFGAKLEKALLLWLEGFGEACCLHRVVILCLRSRKLFIRTGQCFLLNGFIFLGSFILSNLWYNDIAKFGFAAMGRSGTVEVNPLRQKDVPAMPGTGHAERHAGLGGIMIGIGEQVYSILLLSIFFLEIYVTGFLPYIGKALNLILLSWMYAYYCFEYKWNFSEVSLNRRMDFFESNWAFFAGFGSPCVLPSLFFSPLVSYASMAILFPLFVLTATDSGAEQVISSRRRKWGDAVFGRLPIFYSADILSLRLLSLFSTNERKS